MKEGLNFDWGPWVLDCNQNLKHAIEPEEQGTKDQLVQSKV